MRLYLSSENVGNYSPVLLRLVGENRTVLYVGNAKDDWPASERAAKVAEHQLQFEELGFDFEEVDLRNYFDKKDTLSQRLEGKGLVWIAGGNTFLLRRALYDSGFDKLIVKGLSDDAFTYGGSSAGTIIMTPTLHGTENGDNPQAVLDIYKKEVIWDGLGLVDICIVPHYGSGWFGNDAERMAEYYENHNFDYRVLRDGQVYIVDGQIQELLT